VHQLCVGGLGCAARQPNDYAKYKVSNQDTLALKFARDNDVALHTGQKVIDCCATGEELTIEDSRQLDGHLSHDHDHSKELGEDGRPLSAGSHGHHHPHHGHGHGHHHTPEIGRAHV
jgi:hypothetical protein